MLARQAGSTGNLDFAASGYPGLEDWMVILPKGLLSYAKAHCGSPTHPKPIWNGTPTLGDSNPDLDHQM